MRDFENVDTVIREFEEEMYASVWNETRCDSYYGILIVALNYRIYNISEKRIYRILCYIRDNLKSLDKEEVVLFNIVVERYNLFILKEDKALFLNDIVTNINNDFLIYGDFSISLSQFQLINELEIFFKNNDEFFYISAPTSFGKTDIVLREIYKSNYQNILYICPTKSLINEVYSKVQQDNPDATVSQYPFTFKSNYCDDRQNFFITTPERYNLLKLNYTFDMVVVDEAQSVKKIDDERTLQHVFALKDNSESKKVLICPYIYINSLIKKYKNIDVVKEDSQIKKIEFEPSDSIVSNFTYFIKKTDENKIAISYFDDSNDFLLSEIECENYTSSNISVNDDKRKLYDTIYSLIKHHSKIFINSIVYCTSLDDVKEISEMIREKSNYCNTNMHKGKYTSLLIEYLEKYYPDDCFVSRYIKENNFSIHVGYLDDFMKKLIERAFNEENGLNTIVATKTLSQGVNLKFKSIVYASNNRNNSKLDILNSLGRAGRFSSHKIGNRFIVDFDFNRNILGENISISNLKKDRMFPNGNEFVASQDARFSEGIKRANGSLDISSKVIKNVDYSFRTDIISKMREYVKELKIEDNSKYIDNFFTFKNIFSLLKNFNVIINGISAQLLLDGNKSLSDSVLKKSIRNPYYQTILYISYLSGYSLKNIIDRYYNDKNIVVKFETSSEDYYYYYSLNNFNTEELKGAYSIIKTKNLTPKEKNDLTDLILVQLLKDVRDYCGFKTKKVLMVFFELITEREGFDFGETSEDILKKMEYNTLDDRVSSLVDKGVTNKFLQNEIIESGVVDSLAKDDIKEYIIEKYGIDSLQMAFYEIG